MGNLVPNRAAWLLAFGMSAFACATGETLGSEGASFDGAVGTGGGSGFAGAFSQSGGAASSGGTSPAAGGSFGSGGASGGRAGAGGVAGGGGAGGVAGGAGAGGGVGTGGAGTGGGGTGGAGTGGVGTGGVGTGGAGTGGAATGGAGGGCSTAETCNGVDDDNDGLIDEPSSQNTAPCNGCTPIQRNGFAYWFCTGTTRDWQPSETDCVAKGAHLASIHDQAENDFVSSTMIGLGVSGRFWMGVNDKSSEGNYVWLDGTPVDYHYFTCSATTVLKTSSEDCANISGAGGCWDDDDCSGHRFQYVCRAPHQPTCP